MIESRSKEEIPVGQGVPEEEQNFVDARGRPAVFLILPGKIDMPDVIALRNRLRDRYFEELDVVIHTGGGDIHSAYLIIALLRLHAKKLNACVPIVAKSAGTLVCIGADKIVLDEVAQLGPLDTQIDENKMGGMVGGGDNFTSALDPFKSLDHLEQVSFKSLTETAHVLTDSTQLDLNQSFQTAQSFVEATTAPMFRQLQPQKFGQYRRALSVGEEYGKRILKRFHNWEDGPAANTIRQLVHDYPSHHYIIDIYELKEMGFDAELFPKEQRDVVDGLIPYALESKESIVTCVDPSPKDAVEAKTNGSETQPNDGKTKSRPAGKRN
jgi:serine dehydrogenase proteinase